MKCHFKRVCSRDGAKVLAAYLAGDEQVQQQLALISQRAEMFNRLASLVGVPAATLIRKETCAEHNPYGVETELVLQGRICELLTTGLPSSFVIDAAKSKKIDTVYAAMKAGAYDTLWVMR